MPLGSPQKTRALIFVMFPPPFPQIMVDMLKLINEFNCRNSPRDLHHLPTFHYYPPYPAYGCTRRGQRGVSFSQTFCPVHCVKYLKDRDHSSIFYYPTLKLSSTLYENCSLLRTDVVHKKMISISFYAKLRLLFSLGTAHSPKT